MAATPIQTKPIYREIRVLISGVSADTRSERDYLARNVFPEIRRLCHENDVVFTEVDLYFDNDDRPSGRWGLLPLRLDEITQRRPFVIALVGDQIDPYPDKRELGRATRILERYPWLGDVRTQGASLIEAETVEIVTRHPDLRDQIRLYCRSEKSNGTPTDPDSVMRRERLLDRARDLDLRVYDGYDSLEALGERVRRDLVDQIDRIAPSDVGTYWLDRERRGHEAFATTRRRAYVESEDALETLDRYAREGSWKEEETADEPTNRRSLPLAVTGESGAGKSALLAHWSARYRKANPGAFMIAHYVGATASSTDYLGLLRRIMLEIRRRYDLQQEPPTKPEEIVRELMTWLAYARGDHLVIVVDALNQLSAQGPTSFSLDWLPVDFPPHVRLIVSTLEGPALDTLRNRGASEFRVRPLNEDERREVARRFLESQGVRLDSLQLRRFAGNRRNANPLYLRTSLEELRAIGKGGRLNERIAHYLDAADLNQLFDRVLARVERDCGEEIVGAVLSYLWGARYGLSDEELQALTAIDWGQISHLLGTLDYHLIRREGMLSFFHGHLREAVQGRYLPTTEAQRDVHRRLGEYFTRQEAGVRRAEEEPWQWKEAEEWNRLEESLTDLPFFSYLYEGERRYELFRYWRSFPDSDAVDLSEHYRKRLATLEGAEETDPLERVRIVENLGSFLYECAEYDEAIALYRKAIACREKHFTDAEATNVPLLTKLGQALRTKGDYAEAEEVLRRALELTETWHGPDHIETASVLDSLAELLYVMHDYVGGEAAILRALAIRERTLGEEHASTIKSLSDLGAIYHGWQKHDRADACYDRALSLCERALGQDHPLTALVLNNTAAQLQARGEHERAIPLLERAIRINETIFGREHPEVAINLANLAFSERRVNRVVDAENHYRQSLDIARRTLGENHPDVARTLVNLGWLFFASQKMDEAMAAFQKAHSIREAAFGPEHPSTLAVVVRMIHAHYTGNQFEDVVREFDRVAPFLEKLRLGGEPTLDLLAQRYSDSLVQLNRKEEADDFLMKYARLKQ